MNPFVVKSSTGAGRRRYAVFDVRSGERRSCFYDRSVNAECHAAELAEKLARMTVSKPRNCLRCQAEFLSEGAHHRMCDRCRSVTLGRDMIG